MTRSERELNPFLTLNQLMTNKLSREAWTAQCQELGISELVLLPPSHPSEQNPELSQQTKLFS
jgi:hypothetical protein